MNEISLHALSKMIDHSLLHPTLTDDDLVDGCRLSKAYNVATACVKPYAVDRTAELLSGSDVAVCTVIAFPHGNSSLKIKLAEAEDAIQRGAVEIDMVVNIGKVLNEDWAYVSEEIREVNELVTGHRGIVKVIFENDYLEDKHIIKLCEICSEHSVAFTKTSTGYGFVKQPNGMYAYQGATDHHLKLMRLHCKKEVQIKAAGGIRTLDDLLRIKELGVTRVGATATAAILDEAKRRGIA